ncbi:MAG: efflux RND transporter periplasmic adaptor subunit [Defluviicoccus sp.]|nr:efflux RND transporter periplasmic adaptor subunit [Defluviicoccus sp.]MDE0382712.1 efflux RND transporter periplasmic adaptor subunit [Defluviicoccus sp.]
MVLAALTVPVSAQDKPPPLSARAQASDSNNNGVIDRDEARGPLAANFAEMDCDRSNSLDGNEIRAFFTGAGCRSLAAAPPGGPASAQAKPPPLPPRAKTLDANDNDVIDRDEARGPLETNFAAMDCDESNSLDANEIRAHFTGGGCKSVAAASPPAPSASAPGSNRRQRGPPRGGGRPPAMVTLDSVIAEPGARTVPVIGRLVARQSGVVASQVRGAVVEMRVDVGDRVKRGQIVAVLAAGRMGAARDRAAASVARFRGVVAAAEAEYRKKRGELRRIDRLRKSAAFSRARYEDLERDVQARKGALADRRGQLQEAQAQLRQAELDLADTRIKAPFPGVVTQKHIDIGTYLNVGARVVSILNDTDLEAEAEVPSGRLRGLSVGALVTLTLDDGSRHQATVRAIVPTENVRTRTRPVRFTADFGTTGMRLAADQSVTVLIPVGGRGQVATVHKDAVVRSGADAFVFVVEDNLARRVKVRLGDGLGPRFVVLDGVKPGQEVVVRGNETLGRGGPVRIRGATGS